MEAVLPGDRRPVLADELPDELPDELADERDGGLEAEAGAEKV